MKVLAILGTNRRNGLIQRLCDRLLQGANDRGHETETINLHDYDIKNCRGCWACAATSECVIADDFKTVFDKFLQADVIVLGIPCYWGNVPGIVKTFFDRHTGYAMFKPKNADKFQHMKTAEKVNAALNSLKNFGALDGIAGKTYWQISAMTFPFPISHISGDYRGLIAPVNIYAKKLKCKSLHRLVYTDSLLRLRKSKEEKFMQKALRIGKSL